MCSSSTLKKLGVLANFSLRIKINHNYVCIEKDQFTINLKVKSFGKVNNIMVKFKQ